MLTSEEQISTPSLSLEIQIVISVLVLFEKIYQTLKSEFDHFLKHLKFVISTPLHVIFSTPLSIGKCSETWSLMFDIILFNG